MSLISFNYLQIDCNIYDKSCIRLKKLCTYCDVKKGKGKGVP